MAAPKEFALRDAVRAQWREESADWDDLIEGRDPGPATGPVPEEAVARLAPLFEEHLGVPLDVRAIRVGGYRDVEELLAEIPLLAGGE